MTFLHLDIDLFYQNSFEHFPKGATAPFSFLRARRMTLLVKLLEEQIKLKGKLRKFNSLEGRASTTHSGFGESIKGSII